jgi:putative head protein
MAKTKATPTEKYWKKRQEELEKKWDKKSREEIERELRAYYEQSLAHIEKDISALYQRFATDNGMDMAAAQQLLTGKEYRVWRMDIAEYVKEINATGNPELLRELNTLAMRSRITRLDALRAGTFKEMALLSKKTEKAMKEFLKSGYEDFYYHGLYEIGKKRGLEGTVSLVDGGKLERVLRVPWSGKNYSKRIWSNNAKLAKVIQQNIIAAAHRGVSVQDMTRVVRQKMGVGTKEAVRLVRTELNYVQNQAALHSIKDAGMKFYRFIATLDKRTSNLCQSHDGDVFPVEEAMPGKNMPPLHPHCRSVISGCLKGEYRPQSGTRIARDENGKNVLVPANMKYDDWRAVYVDKKLTLEEWEAGNVASQATNATGALNAGAQSGTINAKEAIKKQIAATQLDTCSVQDVVSLGKAVCDEHDILGVIGNPAKLRTIFANYREMGGALRPEQWAKGCSTVNKQMLSEAFAHYPKAWVDYFSATGRKLYTKKTSRGFFCEGAVTPGRRYDMTMMNYLTDYFTIHMEGNRKITPWHEIGHMIECLNPNALRISKEFVADRTSGESLTPLRSILQGMGYRTGEVTKKDNFISPYIGKEYSNASEVLSMGLESLFCGVKQIKRATRKAGQNIYDFAKIEDDEEYMNLIVGLILLA